ncbi:MAG: phosphate ABC transporter permease subunit PstC [Caldilineae bacterium]|nr:MAG: phosphate ABC transporter permease subunit PstC [Caldilineae bacterium]
MEQPSLLVGTQDIPIESAWGAGSRLQRLRERAISVLLLAAGLISILTTIGIILSLLTETVGFFGRPEVSLREFFIGTRWTPQYAPPQQAFGIWPLINGTLLIAIGSAIVSLPIGVASAVYLSEYASDRARKTLKPLLEILAGIPTVVYGYFGITFITPLLQHFIPGLKVFNALAASIVVGVMIIPMVSSMSEDAMHAVPRALREAAYAMGATRLEVSTQVVLPAALSGVLASFILALSRAIGETMAVTMVAGQLAHITLDPRDSVMAMTAYIVNVSLGDTPFGSVEYQSIFAVGMVLFVITLGMNILSHRIVRRYREVYQ